MSFLALPDKPFRTGTGTGTGSSSESSLGLGGRSGRLDLKDDAIMDQDQEPASSYSSVASSSQSPPTARTRHVASPFMPRKDRMKDVEKDIRICSLAELRVMLEKKEGLLNDSTYISKQSETSKSLLTGTINLLHKRIQELEDRYSIQSVSNGMQDMTISGSKIGGQPVPKDEGEDKPMIAADSAPANGEKGSGSDNVTARGQTLASRGLIERHWNRPEPGHGTLLLDFDSSEKLARAVFERQEAARVEYERHQRDLAASGMAQGVRAGRATGEKERGLKTGKLLKESLKRAGASEALSKFMSYADSDSDDDDDNWWEEDSEGGPGDEGTYYGRMGESAEFGGGTSDRIEKVGGVK